MLDLRRLQMFHAVATHRSFSAAALELSYTQSSVSEGVAVLERELGVTLLDRASRPVSLTPAGETVLAHAETLLGQAAAIESDLAALSSGEAGVLRLAAFYTAWSTFLPPAVADFAQSHPCVELEVQLRAGELDLAVTYQFEPGDPAENPDDRLVSTHLAHDAWALAVPAASRPARKGRLKLADLADASWCSPPHGTHATRLLQEYCREHGGFEPRIDYPTRDVAMAQPLIAAGLAVALLPGLNLVQRHPGVTVRQLPQAPPGRDVWCVQPANRRVAAAQAMVDALVRAAGRPIP
jgi:DNA-binding transcriptional LysR family regulator